MLFLKKFAFNFKIFTANFTQIKKFAIKFAYKFIITLSGK